jgi:flagellar biosynthetic protein FliR
VPNFLIWSESQVIAFFFVLARVTSLLLFLPIFGDKVIPPTIKILFGLSFAVVAFPIAWAQGAHVDPSVLESTWKTAWALMSDIGFGMMVGFVARWIFDAVQTAGHFAGTAMGYSMASVLDPHTETQTIAMAELHYIIIALLFLALGGHHFYLEIILDSFRIVPLAKVNLLAQGDGVIQYLISMSAEVLTLGLKLAAPVMVVSLLINLVFGVLARAVPQMNTMAVSFTVNLVVGLIVALVSLPGFVNMVSGAFDSYTPELTRFMRLFRG